MGQILLPKQYHPDFATPGEKPVGPVEIDWNNKVLTALNNPKITLPSGGGFSINGRRNNLLLQGASERHRNNEYLTVESGSFEDGHTLISLDTSVQQSNKSFIVYANVISAQTWTEFASYFLNSDKVSRQGLAYSDTGKLFYQELNSWTQTLNAPLMRFGEPILMMVDVVGAIATIRLHTKTFGYESGFMDHGGTGAQTFDTLVIGAGSPHFRLDARQWEGSFFYSLIVEDGVMGEALFKELASNPYQILKPATAQIYNFPSVAAGTNVPVDTAALSVSEQTITIDFVPSGTEISVDTASLSVTGQDIDVDANFGFAPIFNGTWALTGGNAIISLPVDTDISVDTASVTITENQIDIDQSIAIATDSLSVTGQTVSVVFGNNVPVETATLTVTENQITVIADLSIGVDTATISVSEGTLSVDQDISLATDTLSVTEQAISVDFTGASVVPIETASLSITQGTINIQTPSTSALWMSALF